MIIYSSDSETEEEEETAKKKKETAGNKKETAEKEKETSEKVKEIAEKEKETAQKENKSGEIDEETGKNEKQMSLKTVTDRQNRPHISIPGTGSAKLYEFFAAAELTPSNIAEHVNHLSVVRELEKERTGQDKKIMVLIVDQGADWAYDSPITIEFLYQFFKHEDLNLLICVSHAPGESRFNPIERYFGYLSKARSVPGMMLPGYVLEEEMSMEHLTETEKIYQQSMRIMCKSWQIARPQQDPYRLCVGEGGRE